MNENEQNKKEESIRKEREATELRRQKSREKELEGIRKNKENLLQEQEKEVNQQGKERELKIKTEIKKKDKETRIVKEEKRKDKEVIGNNKTQPALSGKKEGCFVATAVFGNYDAIEVIYLRKFRDESLNKSSLGRIFVKTYYFLSPPLALLIRNSKLLRKFVRNFFLHPIISLLQLKKK